MTFAAINWLDISINLLLVVFVIVCLLMTLIILMQRPKQEGLGAAFGGGVTDQVFGARTTNVLQRGTVYLGSLFFILSLALAVLIGQKNRNFSPLTAKERAAKVETKPAVTEAPKSLEEQLPATDPIPGETPVPVEVPADAPTGTTPPAGITPETETTPVPETAPSSEPAPAPEGTAPPSGETTPPAAPAGDKPEEP